jgi:3',5'-cyclic AMP phosphodiesterase CpdA
MRALRAALAEAKAWGAERLVVKGDITDASDPARLALALRTMGATELPLHLVPGNHDHRSDRRDPADVIIGLGHAVAAPVGHTDLPGIRLILADSSVSSRAAGSVAAWRHDVLDLAAEAPGAVMLAIHHQLMHLPLATYIPAGIPARESRPFLAELGRANPNTFVTSGHTHRHRRRDWGPIVTTEVGSTKDYPGTWAGYLVYEGGIVQTVRRIMAPDVMEWTERTRQIGFGAWGRWSPGRDEHRSFAHAWVARPITLGPTRSVTGARASGSVAVGPDVVDDLVALER